MPRRPRPASRKLPPSAPAQKLKSALVSSRPTPGSVKTSGRRLEEGASESESSGSQSGLEEEESSEKKDSGGEQEEFDADAEPDVPRVAQWVDEEDLEDISDEEFESSSGESEEEVDGDRLEADLKALPFGALRKAQKALSRAQASDDSDDQESEDESGPEEQPAFTRASGLDKGKEREEPRPRKEVAKRKHKHAPVEMTSKRPVGRARFVAEEKVVPRDPRFLHITGEFDPKRFHSQYGFLSDMHAQEMKTLRENLKRARKLLTNSPRDLREEREAEVERLERAVKRAESAVNRDRQDKVQFEALGRAKKEEQGKQKEGKKAWHMKDADKRDLLLRAKYDALAASGGRKAVRKAIEKKQKKVGQKEKKKIPFVGAPPPRMAGGAGETRKRSRPSGDGGPRKRPRSS
ncbi:hypothetical protein VTO73DRAFT_1013 [Trametes versicolor]